MYNNGIEDGSDPDETAGAVATAAALHQHATLSSRKVCAASLPLALQHRAYPSAYLVLTAKQQSSLHGVACAG